MTSIDAHLVNLTERVCHRLQRLTGTTNIWLASQLTNLSIIGYFAWATAYSWTIPIEAKIALGLYCGGLLWMLAGTVFRVPVEMQEQHAYRRVANRTRNPRRLRDRALRIAFLVLSTMLATPAVLIFVKFGSRLAVLIYSLVVLTTTVLYLLACDPLPPCEGKLRAWFRYSVPSIAPVDARPTTNKFAVVATWFRDGV